MAKGNMLQGMARGKVGDLVFSRTNGQQVIRVRNRQPANPRTDEQLYQRAIMATTMVTYSLGKEIFDHAFQGYRRGQECQSRFLSLNTRLLRARVGEVIDHPGEAGYNAFVTAPGIATAINNPWQISEGTYGQQYFIEDSAECSFSTPALGEGTTPAAYAAEHGLIPGDLYTFLIFKPSDIVLYRYAGFPADTIYQSVFGFVRLRVKSDLATTGAVSNLGQLFTAEMSAGVSSTILSKAPEAGITRGDFTVSGIDAVKGMIGCIRSREDADLRSSSYMMFDYPDTLHADGIDANMLLEVWQQGANKLGQSMLILEGRDF